jgi:histidyl-tRNA synthetase
MAAFQTLSGFREFYPEDCATRNFIGETCRCTAEAFGFAEYDAPVLEPTELFTAKSGEEIVAQLFNFEDKGGRAVALRPEMTPSLARMVGARANSLGRPIKLFNISEAFRYERPQRGRLRSFYQFNGDLLGDISPLADAEVIALAVQTLVSFGLTADDFHVRLGDRKLWTLFLESNGVAEEAIPSVLGMVDKIEREGQTNTMANLGTIGGVDGKKVLDGLMILREIRSIGGLVEFFNSSGWRGDGRLEELSTMLTRLDSMGLADFITVDLGIVRGLAYYTGFVFEIFERHGKSRALAGGGRYDNLVKKLGYGDLPAVGFAMGDVTLGNLLAEKNLLPKFSKIPACFILYSPRTEAIAMRLAMELRRRKIPTEYCLAATGFSKQMKVAARAKATSVLIVGEEEAAANGVRVKNMATGEERIVAVADVVGMVVGDFHG